MYPSRVGVHPALLAARDRLLAGQTNRPVGANFPPGIVGVSDHQNGGIVEPGHAPPPNLGITGPLPDPGYGLHPVGDQHQYSGGTGLAPAPGPIPIDPGYSHPVGVGYPHDQQYGGGVGLVPVGHIGAGGAGGEQLGGGNLSHHIGQAHGALGALAHALALRGLS